MPRAASGLGLRWHGRYGTRLATDIATAGVPVGVAAQLVVELHGEEQRGLTRSGTSLSTLSLLCRHTHPGLPREEKRKEVSRPWCQARTDFKLEGRSKSFSGPQVRNKEQKKVVQALLKRITRTVRGPFTLPVHSTAGGIRRAGGAAEALRCLPALHTPAAVGQRRACGPRRGRRRAGSCLCWRRAARRMRGPLTQAWTACPVGR